jgi:hypothetical protein
MTTWSSISTVNTCYLNGIIPVPSHLLQPGADTKKMIIWIPRILSRHGK